MWPRRRNRAVSAAILLLFHAFAGGHAKRGHDGLVGLVICVPLLGTTLDHLPSPGWGAACWARR